jgi:transposase
MGLVVKDDGWRMPDWLWERVEPLLPPRPAHPLGCHNPRVPDRNAMNAILLVLSTGMQWKALDLTGPCSSSSAHRRFQEWQRGGVLHELWRLSTTRSWGSTGPGWQPTGRCQRRRWVALGPARIPPTEPRRGEAIGPCGGRRGPDRARSRGRQPQRPQAAEADARLDPDRAARADRTGPAGHLPGQGLRQPRGPRARRRVRPHAAHPHARRRDRAACPDRAGGRGAGSSRPATRCSTATARS